jgi:hypothetical protein
VVDVGAGFCVVAGGGEVGELGGFAVFVFGTEAAVGFAAAPVPPEGAPAFAAPSAGSVAVVAGGGGLSLLSAALGVTTGGLTGGGLGAIAVSCALDPASFELPPPEKSRNAATITSAVANPPPIRRISRPRPRGGAATGCVIGELVCAPACE